MTAIRHLPCERCATFGSQNKVLILGYKLVFIDRVAKPAAAAKLPSAADFAWLFTLH
jgi:hypothetical protein